MAVVGCGPNAWTSADRAAAAAAETHALASHVANEAEAEDGAALAQAEARAWTERGSTDAALLAVAFRMTESAWEFAHLFRPWVDGAEAVPALAEWKALAAAAEATRDSGAVAAYEAVWMTAKDATDGPGLGFVRLQAGMKRRWMGSRGPFGADVLRAEFRVGGWRVVEDGIFAYDDVSLLHHRFGGLPADIRLRG